MSSSHEDPALDHRRAFQAVLRSQERATLEDYLARWPGEAIADWVAPLAVVELMHRMRLGERPALREYLERFPQHRDALLEALIPYLSSLEPGASTIERPPTVVQANQTIADDVFEVASMGRYELLELVGRGAFGEVWKARDPLLKRTVALKRLRRDRLGNAAELQGLITEGQRLSQLDHPGIVPVYDAAHSAEGIPYLVSKYMAGGTLEARLKRTTFSIPEGVTIVLAVAQGLRHAHQHEIVHRDIKPSNILFDDDDRPRLADFGLAVSYREQSRESPSTAGTPAYMSPEQARGETHLCGPTSDIYSLGVVLYRLLTGRLPFHGIDWREFQEQILNKLPPAPRSLNPAIPAELEDLVLRCLRKNPADRPLSVQSLTDAMLSWQTRSTTPPTTTPQPTAGGRPKLPLLVIGGLLIMVVGASWWWLGNPESPRRPVRPAEEAAAPPAAPTNPTRSWSNPEPLVWMPRSRAQQFGFLPQTNRFQFDATGYAAFIAGSATAERITLRLDADWDDEEGMAGVFWGVRWVDSSQAELTAAAVCRDFPEGPLLARIHALKISAYSDRFQVIDDRILHTIRFDPPLTIKPQILEVQVSADAIEDVLFDGVSVLKQPYPLEASRRFDPTITPDVGYLARNTTLSVRMFTLE